MANRYALSFGDELEGYLDVSQNFFQTHSTTKSDPSGGATTKPARACYNNIGGCAASTQSGPQTHAMTLKKVLADIHPLFQRIPKRQHNPIRHVGDRADNKVNISVPGISTNPLETGLGFQQFHPVRPTLL